MSIFLEKPGNIWLFYTSESTCSRVMVQEYSSTMVSTYPSLALYSCLLLLILNCFPSGQCLRFLCAYSSAFCSLHAQMSAYTHFWHFHASSMSTPHSCNTNRKYQLVSTAVFKASTGLVVYIFEDSLAQLASKIT